MNRICFATLAPTRFYKEEDPNERSAYKSSTRTGGRVLRSCCVVQAQLEAYKREESAPKQRSRIYNEERGGVEKTDQISLCFLHHAALLKYLTRN